MSKTLGYIRVSTDKQDVENQRYGIQAYCEWNGLKVSEWISDVITGSSKFSDRNLGEAFDRLQKGDTLIVTELSRLSRDFFGTVKVVESLLDKKICFHSIKEKFILADDMQSRMMISMYGLMSQMERDKISQRTKEALKRKKAEGMILGRPVGFRIPTEKRKLHPHIEEIRRMVLENVTYTEIASTFGVSRIWLWNFCNEFNIKRENHEKTNDRRTKGENENCPGSQRAKRRKDTSYKQIVPDSIG